MLWRFFDKPMIISFLRCNDTPTSLSKVDILSGYFSLGTHFLYRMKDATNANWLGNLNHPVSREIVAQDPSASPTEDVKSPPPHELIELLFDNDKVAVEVTPTMKTCSTSLVRW
jgi:hypothetical protein